jgi:hypothetical protein
VYLQIKDRGSNRNVSLFTPSLNSLLWSWNLPSFNILPVCMFVPFFRKIGVRNRDGSDFPSSSADTEKAFSVPHISVADKSVFCNASFCRWKNWLQATVTANQYSKSVRAGRSGDRNPLITKFSASVQINPGIPPPPPTSCKMGTGFLFRIKEAGTWRKSPLPPNYYRVWRKSEAVTLLALWAFTACLL